MASEAYAAQGLASLRHRMPELLDAQTEAPSASVRPECHPALIFELLQPCGCPLPPKPPSLPTLGSLAAWALHGSTRTGNDAIGMRVMQVSHWQQALHSFTLVATSAPASAAAAAMAFRPVLVPLLHATGSKVSSSFDTYPSAAINFLISLADIAHVLPYTQPIALDYIKSLPALHILRERCTECGIPLESVSTCILLLLQSASDVTAIWPREAILQLLSASDAFSRWVGVRCAADLLALPNAEADSLEGQLLTAEEQASCSMAWEAHCLRLQVRTSLSQLLVPHVVMCC